MTMRKGEAPLDTWTFVHAASGLALGALGVGVLVAVLLLVVYEIVEALLRKRRSGAGVFEHESWGNIIADIIVGGAAFAIAFGVRSWWGWEPFTV